MSDFSQSEEQGNVWITSSELPELHGGLHVQIKAWSSSLFRKANKLYS